MGSSQANDTGATHPQGPTGGPAESRPPRRWRRFFRRVAITCGILAAVLAVGMVTGEHYMGKPEFCGSCHIMIPYYQSWSHDLHGKKVGTRCVDCHYAPGERFTFHAKFKGLSQLTSYFSGRAGAARPRAHVNDLSCLTAPCHGDRAYMTKSLRIGDVRTEKRLVGGQTVEIQRTPTVNFVHEKHLRTEPTLTQTTLQIEQVCARLRGAAPQAFEKLLAIAGSVDPTSLRETKLRTVLAESGLKGAVEADVLELARLEDLRTRLHQLAGMTCAGCHSYDASGVRHLTVERQICFTCHFTNQGFNRETGACLKCHQAPTRQIAIHAVMPTSQPSGSVMMDHQEIVRRKIDCASCHLDVVQGESRVTSRECAHCHDQAKYAEAFERRTIREVEEYHRAHVAKQTARCPDCHRAIQHRLIEPVQIATSSEFIQPVLDNCQHCHPSHHREQVELLMGVGGDGVAMAMPNAMFGSRINCRACHIQPGSDFKGEPLIKATATTCVACHADNYRAMLDQWVSEMSGKVKESVDGVDRLQKRIDELKAKGQTIPPKVLELVAQARQNLTLVKSGNGIHNRNYALVLLDLCNADVQQAMSQLPAQ